MIKTLKPIMRQVKTKVEDLIWLQVMDQSSILVRDQLSTYTWKPVQSKIMSWSTIHNHIAPHE